MKHKIIILMLALLTLTLNGCSIRGRSTTSEAPDSWIEQKEVEKMAVDKNDDQSFQKSTVYKFPEWFLKDLQIAVNVKFPIKAFTYNMNWSLQDYESYSKKLDVSAVSKPILFAGYTGTQNESYYLYYCGPFDMKFLYEAIKKESQSIAIDDTLTPVYVLEPDKGANSLFPAIIVQMSNGESLAFADDQVITISNHAGMQTYIVYPVKGIKIPSQ